MSVRVGVLGASGAVGADAVRALRAAGVGELRLGARRTAGLAGQAAEVVAVDLERPDRLARFCADCTVVLNCAGPSYRVRGRVARAAVAAGADYVDVAGDEPAYADLSGLGLAGLGRRAVLSAGMLPGLSGLLPRWLAEQRQEGPHGGELTVWSGGLERCSRTVAADLVLSLGGHAPDGRPPYGEPLAAWRAGRRESRALQPRDDAELPSFPGPVALRPVLSAEAERLARALRLDRLDWFNVFPGRRVRDVLAALAGSGGPTDEAAERLARACAMDLTGRRPYYRMVFAFRTAAGSAVTATLGTEDSCRLTGAVGALAVTETLAGRVPPGLHFAAEVLDPGRAAGLAGPAHGATLDVAHAPLEPAVVTGAL
ncbi:saccharopine dehydrogenase NADP-binding domain-containing protein [Streptomyces sp. NPDC020983]|uniref:saccharopine dehydrogenase NADP-binding domain-containing protein n=1 Tax=Streptomyces sp. NPDC020983 TaxID=3365106 RepID=UPI00379CF069